MASPLKVNSLILFGRYNLQNDEKHIFFHITPNPKSITSLNEAACWLIQIHIVTIRMLMVQVQMASCSCRY